MKENNKTLKSMTGLSDEQVLKSREKNGINKIAEQKKESVFKMIIDIFKEPMFLLLIVASSVYFIVGEYQDGIVMLIFVLGICFIEYIQETKTNRALEELNKLSSLNVKIIRNNKEVIVSSEEIVVGDIVFVEEGDSVPADGKVVYAQSLGVNESTLTGESQVVYKKLNDTKDNHFKLNMCYAGTSVTNGFGVIKITAVGKKTEIGLIGESLNEIINEKTPLEYQTNKLVLICTIISGIIFLLTIILNFINYSELEFSERIIKSIISGVTVAMATIPEEIPVVFTVFLAMGAWSLTKQNALTRNMKSIEALGAVNVLCTDKTGTLTENKMEIQEVFEYSKSLIETMYLSCPLVVYDPMEQAIKNYCGDKDNNKYKEITKAFAFTPETKMTGQVWDNKILCVKGAYEMVLPLCNIDEETYLKIENKINDYSNNGYRVLALARQNNIKKIPDTLLYTKLDFEGLIALYDPPRFGVQKSLSECNSAGIRVIMITGDNGETARGIAKKIKLDNYDNVITGSELEKMSEEELFEKAKTTNIFARVYPNHKMRIVNALQKDGKIVAMTGDGVNDAPALKQANIGIAMGKRGTNVAKEAADIVLLDDNFNTIVNAVENGRTIYKNIKKSISFLLSIHIPIALLAVFVPMFKLPTLLLPIHVMLLELLIDPTSSIVFQRIKPSKEIMKESPRKIREPLLSKRNVIISILQGLMIFLVTFVNYIVLINNYVNDNIAITVTYSTLVLSILLITYQIRSRSLTLKSFVECLKDKVSLIINICVILGLIILIYVPFFNDIANTAPLDFMWWIYIISLVLLSVIPFDIEKIRKKK